MRGRKLQLQADATSTLLTLLATLDLRETHRSHHRRNIPGGETHLPHTTSRHRRILMTARPSGERGHYCMWTTRVTERASLLHRRRPRLGSRNRWLRLQLRWRIVQRSRMRQRQTRARRRQTLFFQRRSWRWIVPGVERGGQTIKGQVIKGQVAGRGQTGRHIRL